MKIRFTTYVLGWVFALSSIAFASDTVVSGIESTPDSATSIALGNVHGQRDWRIIGERENVGTTTTGEDVWRGVTTTIPRPIDAGEQMEVVSSSAADAITGTGIRTLKIHCISATGLEFEETISLNGTIGVPLIRSDCRFVNELHAMTVGSNSVAVGDITIYKQGAVSTIYSIIVSGGNASLVGQKMVPLGKTFVLKHWHGSEAQGKRLTIRLRSTDHGGTLLAGVFIFKDVAYLSQSVLPATPINIAIPELSIIKVTAWALIAGGEVAISIGGVLVDN